VDTAALRHWSLTGATLERARHGNNNDTYFVTAEQGEFVLRVYRNTAEVARVRDEHDLLGALALQDLPFAVPAPQRTTEGDTLAVLESADGPRLATLFARIPGETAGMVPRDARLAARALAQVDLALARLDRPVRAPATICDVHPLVLDPIAALDELELGERYAGARAILERVDETQAALVASLPLQVIHGDFAYVNVLIQEGAVCGMLDFEFASADIRAADLACGLYVTTVRSTEPERWPLLEALAAGYRRSIPLDPAEAAAIPELMRRRSAFGIVHWIGRYRQGIASRQEPIDRIDRGAALAAWLDANAMRLALTTAGATGAAGRAGKREGT
jgi:Ser/Thr protein kinase RdoA (MazF antagonist)